MRHVLLLEHDHRNSRWIEETLAQAGLTDILLWHEPTLSRALVLLQLCRFSVILVSSQVPDVLLHQSLHALRRQARDTPIVVLHDSPAHAPSDVHAVVRRWDASVLLSTLDALLRNAGGAG